ncbi:MAG TPA: ATP-dependent DNA helicase [Candidatus Eisenbacteria bacterium]|jgi:DNA helicase-2/ATP-dependent DNA helicase PcrA|nr:ATP-dependent DNA helicase [Candidatus Eisenbacteria bacterium]
MRSLFEPARAPDSAQLGLNAAQQRAIEHGDGPLLVIAGAGTGKTRVITERIRSLFERDEGLRGENVLALTYTIKAAGEMLRRIRKSCGERADGITVNTFHGFCEALLKEGAPHRKPIAPVDHWILLRRNMRRLQLEKYRRLAEPGQFLNDFLQFFSRCQDELVTSEQYQHYADAGAAKLEGERLQIDEETYRERLEEMQKQQEIARAYQASEELLNEKNMVALNGLISEAVKLLEGDAALRERMQKRFRHVLVDEFQDTNIAQLRLLELLTAWPRNIVAVGDNDQAIYRFRGASFGSFKLFLERFAGWKQGQDSTKFRVLLKENYRSTPNILRVATQVIAQNETSADFPNKVLEPNKPEGERVRIAELATAEEEALWVASQIERAHKAGKRWGDFAVLYRQHTHRDLLVPELARRKIPFVINRLSILDHPLVRDVLAYLRLIARPYDNVSAARALAAPAWGLEPADLQRLAERARKERKAIYDVLQSPQAPLPFDARHAALADLTEHLNEQRKAMRRRTAQEILSDLLEWLELLARASTQDQKYVKRLTEFAKEWEAKSETRRLPEFLEYLDYFQQANETIALEDEAPGDAVQLMTVHGAKGLEFLQVYVLRVNSRAFPVGERSSLFAFPVELMKEELPQGDFHTQEERRLFYVALTRAQDKLTLTTLTEKRGKVPTFIEDILMAPAVKQRDVLQIAPKVLTPVENIRTTNREEPQRLLFAAQGPARIFSRIAGWAESYHPPVPEPLTLSPSAVMGYRACPQLYLFETLWSIAGEAKATWTFGRVIHATIRRALAELKKGRKLPFEEVQRIYETEWSVIGYEDDYQEEEYRKDGLEQLKAFYQAMCETLPEILEQEKTFELDLENNVIVKGRIDQLNSLGRKDVEIVDYKTGKAKKDSEANKDLQLSIYAIAAKEIFELNPVRLVFHYLQDNKRQTTTRNAKQLAEAQKIVQEVAAEIRAGEFAAKPGFQCRSCAYRPICPAHEEALAERG